MDETEVKQNYLREEIIDKGYDANNFSQFLINKKGDDALDLELWTMEELVDIVSEFKNIFKKYQENSPSPNKIQNYYEEETMPQNKQYDSNPNQYSTLERKISDPKELTKENSKEENSILNSNDPFLNLDINYQETIPAKKLKKCELQKYEKINLFISS